MVRHLSLGNEQKLQDWIDTNNIPFSLEPTMAASTWDEEHTLTENDFETQQAFMNSFPPLHNANRPTDDIEIQYAIMNSIQTQHNANRPTDRPRASRVHHTLWYFACGRGTPPTRKGAKKMTQGIRTRRVRRGREA